MIDEDGLVYRLTVAGTYEPVRNLSSQMHEVDESLLARDEGAHGIGRESDAFEQRILEEAEIARQMLKDMDMLPEPEPDPGFTPSLYDGVDMVPRMERLSDDIARESELAEQIMRATQPRLFAE